MIPILYPTMETAFESNGIGRLTECLSCTVEEDMTGLYECTFEYPITGRLYQELLNGGIILCYHDDTQDAQPFDIYHHTTPVDGVVTFYAHHVGYRLNNLVVTSLYGNDLDGVVWNLNNISQNSGTEYTSHFVFSTDFESVSGYDSGAAGVGVRNAMEYVRELLLPIYPWEVQYDRFRVQLLEKRGLDTGVTVRYGKNITDLTRDVDYTGTFNAAYGFWYDQGSGTIVSTTSFVRPTEPPDGPVIVSYVDLSGEYEEQPSMQTLVNATRAYLDNNKPWIPLETLDIDFAAIWQTDEYAQYAELQNAGVGDTVSVYYPDADIVREGVRVSGIVYDVLAERIDRMSIGQLDTSYVSVSSDTTRSGNGSSGGGSSIQGYNIYASVTELNYSLGTAWPYSVLDAMPVNSILLAKATDFASGSTPGTDGTVEIVRTDDGTRGWIYYHGVNGLDYKLDYSDLTIVLPWVQMVDQASLATMITTADHTETITVGANDTITKNYSYTNSNYDLVGIAGWNLTGSGAGHIFIPRLYVSAANTISAAFTNTSGISVTCTIVMYLLLRRKKGR